MNPAKSSNFPTLFTIGPSGRLEKADIDREYDGDVRGFVCMWRPPITSATYVMGIDPTQGITGWNRYSRVKEDQKTNNGVIEILKVGMNGAPDEQCLEFAAPIDPFELGEVANVLGRLYAGTDQDQCKIILEITGPGPATAQTLLTRGYVNLFRWQYYADTVATETKTLSFGWHASPRSLRDLWIKASHHVNLDKVLIYSSWLVEEYADCRMDLDRGYAISPNNDKGHGDRVRAMNLALWAANSWTTDIERTSEPVKKQETVIDYQASDMTMEEIMAAWASVYNSCS